MNSRKKKFKVFAAAGLAILNLVGCAGVGGSNWVSKDKMQLAELEQAIPIVRNKDSIVFKMSIQPTEDSSMGIAAKKFASLVNQRTSGGVVIEVYPNGVLSGGNQNKAIEMAQSGAIDILWMSSTIQTAVDLRLAALNMPFVWKDYETLDEVINLDHNVGKKLETMLKEKGLVLLGFGENGFRDLTNNIRPVSSPQDLKGLKLRVIGNKMLHEFFTSMGAIPTNIDFSELFSAMQQKTVDGQENPLVNIIIPNRYYEVQKYFSPWHYCYDPFFLEMNPEAWAKLDEKTQDIFKEAAKEAGTYQKKLARNGEAKGIEFIKGKGVEIAELTDEQLNEFKKVAAPIIEKYKPEYGEDFVNEILEANK